MCAVCAVLVASAELSSSSSECRTRTLIQFKGIVLNDRIKEYLIENVLHINTEAVSAQFTHFYEVCILIIALLLTHLSYITFPFVPF